MRARWLDHCRLNIGITRRLFLVLLAACLVTAIGVALATRWSFQQGFIAYLDEREAQRIEAIAFSLATAWEANRNWDFIRDDDNRQPKQTSILEFTADCRTGTALPKGLVLYDKQLRHVAGNESTDQANVLRQPIASRGEVVGTLVGTPRRALSTEAELRFQRHQIQTSGVVGIAVAVLAAMLAAVFARGLLTPINDLIKRAIDMARGNYGVRVLNNRSDELGTLVSCFNTMAQTLQSNEIKRRQFMDNVSHELRAPLAILHAELEALKDGIRMVNTDSIHTLQDETQILTRLVDDLRQLSPTTVGELQYDWQELDLVQLVDEERRVWHKQLAAKGMAIDVECHTELRIRADQDRLRQVLRNLIDNSRRHATDASVLRLVLHRENGSAVIECHDNGPGIADVLTTNLFDRRVIDDHLPQHNAGGSGCGLAICHGIIAAHGGRIEAARSALGGLCIRMHLPLIKVKT